MEKKLFKCIIDFLITFLSIVILFVMVNNIRFDDTRFINVQSFLLTALIFYLSKFADETYGVFEKEHMVLKSIGLALSVLGLAIVIGCYCKIPYMVDVPGTPEYNNSIAFIQDVNINTVIIIGLFFVFETIFISIQSIKKYYKQIE